MRLLFLLITTILLTGSACDFNNDEPEQGANECFDERLDDLKKQTRAQDAGSLTRYKNNTTDEAYYVYYYAEDRGMLDKGSITVVDADCTEICTGSIMTHWTFCVEDLNPNEVTEVEVIWTND